MQSLQADKGGGAVNVPAVKALLKRIASDPGSINFDLQGKHMKREAAKSGVTREQERPQWKTKPLN
jgi:hypothetical protein